MLILFFISIRITLFRLLPLDRNDGNIVALRDAKIKRARENM